VITTSQHPSAITAQVMENLEVAPGHYRMSLCLPDFFDLPHPGQFVMIREGGRNLFCPDRSAFTDSVRKTIGESSICSIASWVGGPLFFHI